MKFSTVAEVHSSAVDDDGDPSVICTSRQRSAVVLDPMVAPKKEVAPPPEEVSVLEPLEHSVLGVSLEGGEESIDEVALMYLLEHSGVGRATDVVFETSVLEPLEHLVLEVPLDEGGESVESRTVSDPLEHSGVSIHYPFVFLGRTRRRSRMEEVVRGTIGLKIVHSRTSGRSQAGPAGRDHCCRGCWLDGTLVSDGLGGRDGSRIYD